MASAILILLLLTGFDIISNAQAYYRKSPAEPEGRFNETLELTCSYKKSDTAAQSLTWFRDDTVVASGQTRYSVEKKPDQSTLKIHNLELEDEKVVYWFGQVDNAGVPTRSCDFKKIRVLPQILTDRSDEKLTPERITIRRQSREPIRLTCRLTAAADSALIPKWEFSPENKDFHELPNDLVVQDNDLIIDTLGRHHRGYYRCSFANRDGTSTVLLRMKDRFAAWWPFLGIVAVVIVCVIIILAIEKRRKAAQKAAAAATDEKTSDPLVRETSKSNVDESKKSYVNA